MILSFNEKVEFLLRVDALVNRATNLVLKRDRYTPEGLAAEIAEIKAEEQEFRKILLEATEHDDRDNKTP